MLIPHTVDKDRETKGDSMKYDWRRLSQSLPGKRGNVGFGG
jgi:hypothetical protein